MSNEARRLEFIDKLKVHKIELAKPVPEGAAPPLLPKPLMDGVRAMLGDNAANADLCAKFAAASRDRDAGPPAGAAPAAPIEAADCDAAIAALEAMAPGAPPAPAPPDPAA